jgi:ATP-binding cassette subfamily B protein
MNAVFSLLSNFGLIFAIIWCSFNVLHDGVNADYGAMLSVVLLLMQLQQPFMAFSSWVPIYYARITSGERLYQVEAIAGECTAANFQDKIAYNSLAEISFENVDFSYGRDTILSKASGVLRKGEIVCVTGPSGAGKSTLFKLLLNVLRPNEGKLWLVDKQGEKTPLTANERGLFSYVPQGKFLFSGTIYENLTFFTKSPEDEKDKIKKAIEVACAEFVWGLPQGLQTHLGENGVGLSEGQMQRLAVARAILSERPILLLDEATSALDGETERKLLENIKALPDKTCFIVTHRPAAFEIADRIITVENGKIA